MRRILVTGAAGFLGNSLVRKIDQNNFEIYTTDQKEYGFKSLVKHIQGDLSSDFTIKQLASLKIDCVIHLAAQTGVMNSIEDPSRDLVSNVFSTVKLLEILPTIGCKHFIFGQSGGSIYSRESKLPADEESSVHPESPYGISKLTSETYVRYFCERFNIGWSSLAFSNLYGSIVNNKKGVIYEFANRMSQN